MRIYKNPLKPLLAKIPVQFRNKFFWVLLFFAIWMLVFDNANFFTQWKLNAALERLEADKQFYTEQIEKVKQQQKDFDSNIEKFAREKYFMQKDNEDVFIIVEKE